MTAIASSSASTASPGESRDPPAATIASQNVAGAQAELGAAVAEDVERGHRAGEHGWRPQRQVGHVGRDPYGARASGDRRQQGPGVEVLGLVGVVLHRDQVEAEDVGQLGELEGAGGVGRVGGEEDAELQLLAVVRHGTDPNGVPNRLPRGRSH